MNLSYPTGALTKLARAFMPQGSNADTLKAQAYMAQAAAGRDRDLAAADKLKAETVFQNARNQAATLDGQENAVGAMFGFNPEDMAAWRASRISQPVVQKSGVETFPLEGPTTFRPTGNLVNQMPLGSGVNEQIAGLEQAIVNTPQVEMPRRSAPARDFSMQNNLLGQMLMQMGLTGTTNAEQLQGAARKALETNAIHGVNYGDGGGAPGDIALMQRMIQMGASPDKAMPASQAAIALADVLQGRELSPQAMALMKAGAVFNSQGINNYTGQGGDAFNIDQANAMQRERIQSNDRRYSTNVGAATTRRGQDMTDSRGRWEHTTPGANKGSDKAAADESEAINGIDLSLPIVPQVAKSDPDYQQFYRIYSNAKKAGDLRTMRALVHKAVKNGIIQQGE